MKRLNGMLRSSSQWKVSTPRPGDDALAQRLDVVAVGLALDHRALAEPAAGRQPVKVIGMPIAVSLLIFSRPSITPNQ